MHIVVRLGRITREVHTTKSRHVRWNLIDDLREEKYWLQKKMRESKKGNKEKIVITIRRL